MLENNESVYRAALISQSPYVIPFPFWRSDDIQVWVTRDGIDTQLSVLDYSISDNQLTLSASAYEQYQGADSITIMRIVEPLQTTDYTNGTHINAEVIEQSLDKLTAMAQQLSEAQKRSIKTSVSEEGSDVTLPSAEGRADSLLGFASDGNTMTVRPMAQFDADVASAANNAQISTTAKEQAEFNASLSRQYAEGKKLSGDPVGEGEAGYHENSRYWADQAAEIRPNIETSLIDYDQSTDSYTLTIDVVYNA